MIARGLERDVADRLAEILVKEGGVSEEALRRASERQEEAGGALDTALLELKVLDEERLAGLLGRAAGLPSAPPSAWGEPDARARRVFPAKVAERHGIAPFALEGRELSVVSAYPPDLGLLDEISFMLSLHLRPHVAPEWRVRELVHRLYGTRMPARLEALARRTDRPEADAVPEPDVDLGEPPAEAVAASAPPAAAPAVGRRNGPTGPVVPASPPGAPPPPPGPEGPAGREVERARAAGPPSAREGERGRASGPGWTVAGARAALASARDRDEVIAATIRYARDFFEYAAMFAVTRDALYGYDAMGREEGAREECRGVAVELADPGFFRTPIETRGPYLGPPSLDPVTASILAGLRRGTPRTVLLHPVFVRDRPVAVLYADNGDAPVSARRLGDLFLVLGSLGSALERVIRERKLHPPPGPGEEGWKVTEPGRIEEEPLPVSVDVDLGDYEVAPIAEALSSPRAIDVATLVQRLARSSRGSAERASLVSMLAQRGAEAAAALGARMPGPVEVPDELAEATPVQEHGPVLAALAALGQASTRPLLAALSDPDADRRRYAVLLLGGRGDPTVLPSLAVRAFDEDARVAAAAREALAGAKGQPELRPVIDGLRRELASGKPTRAAHAARALARLGDVESVPPLVQLLESGGELGGAALEALSRLTLQRLGSDPARWLAWWQQHRGSPRSRWLLEALTSPDREARQAASEELRQAGSPPVPYFADAPAPERERAARAWAEWWHREGPAT